MVEQNHPLLSVREQAKLLNINRSGLYYVPHIRNNNDLELKELIGLQYLSTPFYGSRRMRIILKEKGFEVSRTRVSRLMKEMGIRAIFPKPNLSKRRKDHKVYPYLLKDLDIVRPNQVWATDITYIPIPGGHVYLVAILDWYSRKVLSWRLSTSMSVEFCLEALEEALERHGIPEIFNTDQGSQFTSKEFTSALLSRGVSISMDSKGRCLDNIIVERFWRSLKYEMIFLQEFVSVRDLKKRIRNYMDFYNHRRPHQSHGYKVPAVVYREAA